MGMSILVALTHVLVVAFACCAPWSSVPWVVAMHAILMPFMWVHWLLNDDTCALSQLEAHFRGVPVGSSFVHRLVSPLYMVHEQDVNASVWLVSVALWCVSVYRLFNMPSKNLDVL